MLRARERESGSGKGPCGALPALWSYVPSSLAWELASGVRNCIWGGFPLSSKVATTADEFFLGWKS